MNASWSGTVVAADLLGMAGRLLSQSKSEYRTAHPTHTVVFNANVCTHQHGKIWYGDLDVILDGKKLQLLANTLGTEIYALREMDARFEYENDPQFDNAVTVIWPEE